MTQFASLQVIVAEWGGVFFINIAAQARITLGIKRPGWEDGGVGRQNGVEELLEIST